MHASNVDDQVLEPAVEAASETLAKAERPVIEHCTMHSLRRTFISLLLEAGASVPYTMAQASHKNPQVTLSIYARVIELRGTQARGWMPSSVALIGHKWAQRPKVTLQTARHPMRRQTKTPA